MLSNTEAIATVAVKDLKKAAAFYENTLGLKPKSREGDEVISYGTGSTVLNVYRSEFAGPTRRPRLHGWSATGSTPSSTPFGRRASLSSTTTCRG